MATTSKLSFRARNLDANRGMRVFFADELPDISECAPIARGVNPMPTGMEKEEEMETHLQDAIHAQQASTSGISDNHVIPTPKVLYIDDVRYDQTYPVQPPCKAQLMKVQAWLSMEREEAEYDMDSEDEEYLRDKPHISPRDLEKIMEKLEEQSSESAICQPATARKILMPLFHDNVIDDVYDYWLAKRKEAATNKTLGFGGLIPRIRTECRKENEKLNPYVAFRRRAEKMQTRKNRKNDEDSYEKVLRLGHDLRRAVHLFEMVKRREKSKLAMIELDSEILETRARLGDYGSVVYNQILARLQPEEEELAASQQQQRVPPVGAAAAAAVDPSILRSGEENGVKRKKMRKRVSALSGTFDRDLPNKAWLKKNAEVWNQSPAAFIQGLGTPAVEQVDQSVAAANTATADGRYTFKRKRHAHYRAAIPLKDKNTAQPSLADIPPEKRFYYVSLPSTSRDAEVPPQQPDEAAAPAADSPRKMALLRRRIGRGGRVVFDRFPMQSTAVRRLAAGGASDPSSRKNYVAGRTSAIIYDPFELDCVGMDSEETSKWEARRRPNIVESEDEDSLGAPPVSARFLHSSRHRATYRPIDEMEDARAEEAWLASAISPSPSPVPPPVAVAPSEPEEPAVAAVEAQDLLPPPPPAKREEDDEVDDEPMPCGSATPSDHDDSTTATATPTTPLAPLRMEKVEEEMEDDCDDEAAGCKPNGAAAAVAAGNHQQQRQHVQPQQQQHDEDEELEEDRHEEADEEEVSSDSPIEDSPTSSSEQGDVHTETHNSHSHHSRHSHHHLRPLPLPLGDGGERTTGAHHLSLAAGNASVLSPPDSTAPSPRVSNGSSSFAAAGAAAAAAASPAPHSNGHNGHAGSGNGVARGYEAAAAAALLTTNNKSSAADAWRVRAKLVQMEAVASRLSRVKDLDASSRESGCSPTGDESEKGEALPSPSSIDSSMGGVDGVVVRLVEPWREPSNSPSESNSSADWTPPASTRTSGDVDARLASYATLSSEEESGARTGDHPALPAKPPRNHNNLKLQHQQQQQSKAISPPVQLGLGPRSFAPLATATATPSPVV